MSWVHPGWLAPLRWWLSYDVDVPKTTATEKWVKTLTEFRDNHPELIVSDHVRHIAHIRTYSPDQREYWVRGKLCTWKRFFRRDVVVLVLFYRADPSWPTIEGHVYGVIVRRKLPNV